MLSFEYDWIERKLGELLTLSPGLVLNVGSGPLTQGSIHLANLSMFSSQRNELLNIDSFGASGVDLVLDVEIEESWSTMASLQPQVVVASNILEHLSDPQSFCNRLVESFPSGTFLIITVPYSYPYHPDPIDNGLRLNDAAIVGLLHNVEVVDTAVLVGPIYLRRMIGHSRMFFKTVVGGPLTRISRSRIRHLFRRMKVGAVVVRVL